MVQHSFTSTETRRLVRTDTSTLTQLLNYAVLGFPSLISRIVYVDCCVKVEVAVLGSPSLISLMVSEDCCVKVEVAVLGSRSTISLIVPVDLNSTVNELLLFSLAFRPKLDKNVCGFCEVSKHGA